MCRVDEGSWQEELQQSDCYCDRGFEMSEDICKGTFRNSTPPIQSAPKDWTLSLFIHTLCSPKISHKSHPAKMNLLIIFLSTQLPLKICSKGNRPFCRLCSPKYKFLSQNVSQDTSKWNLETRRGANPVHPNLHHYPVSANPVHPSLHHYPVSEWWESGEKWEE